MAERNNNLMICSLLNTEPAGRGGGGRLAAAAGPFFVGAVPWRKQALVEIPPEPSLGWHASDMLLEDYSPILRAQGTGTFIKI